MPPTLVTLMRWLILSLLLTATPLSAEEEERGRDLMAEALRLFMKGLMTEMEPAMEGIEGLLNDLNAYHPPEVLPNGDIIIRRRQPLEIDPEDEGEVEL